MAMSNGTKVIFSPQLAQWLLHNGYRIVDLKPKRGSENESVFVFEKGLGFNAYIEAWIGAKRDDEEIN